MLSEVKVNQNLIVKDHAPEYFFVEAEFDSEDDG